MPYVIMGGATCYKFLSTYHDLASSCRKSTRGIARNLLHYLQWHKYFFFFGLCEISCYIDPSHKTESHCTYDTFIAWCLFRDHYHPMLISKWFCYIFSKSPIGFGCCFVAWFCNSFEDNGMVLCFIEIHWHKHILSYWEALWKTLLRLTRLLILATHLRFVLICVMCLSHGLARSRGGHSYMYLVTHMRRKGIYHGAIYLKIWNSLHPISTDKSNFFHFRWPYMYL